MFELGVVVDWELLLLKKREHLLVFIAMGLAPPFPFL